MEEEVRVLGGFKARFRCYAASAAGRKDLDATGKVLLPHACLPALHHALGGLPATLLLRLSSGAESLYVGVAEFVEEARVASMLHALLGPAARAAPVPRLHAAGPLAVVFVPRWVRSSLLLEPLAPEVELAAVSMGRATLVRLEPRDERLAAALRREHDARRALTDVMNRFVALAVGHELPLRLGGEAHVVRVVGLRAAADVRCGAVLDDEPAAPEGASTPGGGRPAAAACLVDSDVEVEFAPSATAVATAAEEEERRRAAEEERRAAMARDREEREEEAAVRQRSEEREASARALLEGVLPRASEGLVEYVIRCPDGSRCAARLSPASPFAALFWLVDSRAAAVLPLDFRLVTTFPRKCYERPPAGEDITAGPTLHEMGLGVDKQYAFFVEV